MTVIPFSWTVISRIFRYDYLQSLILFTFAGKLVTFDWDIKVIAENWK